MKKLIVETSDQTLEPEKNKVVNLLNQFMIEMKQWELACLEQLKGLNLESDDLAVKEMKFKSNLENIYRKYCTPKKRKRNRLGSYGIPPNYDPETEKVVGTVLENRNRIIVLSERDIGIKIQYKYVALRRNRKWLIDNRQRLDRNGKWRKDVL